MLTDVTDRAVLEKCIGSGNFGAVHRARIEHLDMLVSLKCALSCDVWQRQSLENEVKNYNHLQSAFAGADGWKSQLFLRLLDACLDTFLDFA